MNKEDDVKMIPGVIISLLTFPGVIAHEFGHKFFCDRFKVKVHEVKYFQFGNPVGYVVHDTPDKFYKTFFIDVGPFFVNTALAVGAFFIVYLFTGFRDMEPSPLAVLGALSMWLGVSFGMNAFPSRHDAKVLWKESTKHLSQGDFMALVGFPFSVLIWISNILSIFWFDLIYALGLLLLVYQVTRLIIG